ncbi:hypothetical protein, partial [Clostridium tyrobutyricum]|uniref:hypothetical protein n=1 Tax=Clostridium tyrobutyricum TaxID=1519 RepID=UPI001C386097
DYVIDNTPPGIISNFVALAGNTKVTLNWANPVDEDFAGVKIIRKVGSYPENITDGDSIYNGTNISYEDNELTNDMEYFYRAFTYDTSDNYNYTTEGQQVSATPSVNIDTTPPGIVNNFTATAGNGKVDLSWVNPTDEDFAGVKILRKTTGYPSSTTDGDLVYNGAGISFEDTTIENDITYYYRVFPYDTAGNYNITEEGQEVTVTPSSYKIYGVKIDTTNSNPETAVTYTDDAVNMTGGSSDWDNKFPFNVIKPCLLKAGVVQYYLNPNDFTKKEDGSASDITSGADGDVMIEIPKMAYAIYYEGTDLYIKITDIPDAKSIDSRFCYYAHTRDNEGDKAKLYVGAYLGFGNETSVLYSLSNKAPTTGYSMETYRTQAQAKGTGYDILSFYPLTLLQCLYLIRYKNLDSQTALGQGYSAPGQTTAVKTGGTDIKGMNFGEDTGNFQMKFCGLEDFWGNLAQIIDGVLINETGDVLTSFKNFNNTGLEYSTICHSGVNITMQGYISKVFGSKIGFIPQPPMNGSCTTYYTDYGNFISRDVPCAITFGGYFADYKNAGVFRCYFNLDPTAQTSTSIPRLMYL